VDVCSHQVPQVVADPGGGAVFVSDPKKPVGGHVVREDWTVWRQARPMFVCPALSDCRQPKNFVSKTAG
jgi:hypothetical protein